MKYHIVTTSKKLQLEIGRMSLETQQAFCQFLQEMFEEREEDSLLLSFKKNSEQNDDSGGIILVTESRNSTNRGRVYHLSPA